MRPINRGIVALLLLAATAAAGSTRAASVETRPGPEQGGSAPLTRRDPGNDVSPVLQIRQPADRGGNRGRRPREAEVRTIDGSGNNVVDTEMGATFIPLARIVEADYGDGLSTLAGAHRPGPREVSNAVCAQVETYSNELSATDYLWQWGQFVDHDLDLTDGADPPEPAPIPVPAGDAYFDPDSTGEAVIFFNRSLWDPGTGTDAGNPRQQVNEITAWIDASNVYGADEERAEALRTLDGTGKLRVTPSVVGDLLPPNETGLPNAGGGSAELFLAGDVRANEQVGLTVMHTLFVREHNRLAAHLAERNPDWTGDEIYEHARRLVGAMMQAITYKEFLPALLGPGALPPYGGYRPDVDARISTLFSTVSYRFGHSALSPTLMRLDAEGDEIAEGHLALRDAFFNPWAITQEGGIEPLLRGLAGQACQRIDPYLVDEVRNFLFGEPGSTGFDLASLNIQRGRDHGLPGYNAVREALGLDSAEAWQDMHAHADSIAALASVYTHPDDIDVWVGALSEAPLPGAHVGELNHTVIRDQFERLRDGDRFWYQRVLGPEDVRMVEESTLAAVIRRNTEIDDEIRPDVFHLPAPDGAGSGPGPRPGSGGRPGDNPPPPRR